MLCFRESHDSSHNIKHNIKVKLLVECPVMIIFCMIFSSSLFLKLRKREKKKCLSCGCTSRCHLALTCLLYGSDVCCAAEYLFFHGYELFPVDGG